MGFFGKRKPPAGEEVQELQVVAAILATCGDDDRSRSLFEQYAKAKDRTRTETADGFTVEPAGKVDADLLVDLPADVASEWVKVHDATSQTPLEFRLVLRAGGRFGALEARAPGGTWPANWRIDGLELAQAARGSLKLPPAAAG